MQKKTEGCLMLLCGDHQVYRSFYGCKDKTEISVLVIAIRRKETNKGVNEVWF